MRGGAHSSPSALGLGISVPPPTHPKFTSFVWDWDWAKGVLSSATRLQEIKNPIIYKPGPHSQPCLCPHGHLFFLQNCRQSVIIQVIHIGIIMHYNAFNVYCRELAPGTVSLTGDRTQGDDSKHCTYSTVYTRNIIQLAISYNSRKKFLGHSRPLADGKGEKSG